MSFERMWHRHYPEGVPPELDFDRLTMPEILTRSAERWPDRPALHYMGKDITFAELEALVNRFARALDALGVKPGDRVATMLPNLPQVVIAHYATYRVGAVTAPANPLYTERELLHHLQDSGSAVLVALDLLYPRVAAVRPHTALEEVVVCHLNDYLPFPKKQLFPLLKKEMYRKVEGADHTHQFLDLVASHAATPLPNRARWEETGALLYTGGTTGISKGAVLTHANLSCNVQQVRTFLASAVDGEERELAVFPFFHSAGYTGVQNMCVYAGWTDILVPRPDPEILVPLIDRTHPTILPGVPTIYTGLLAHPRFARLDLTFVKVFIAGAAPLPVDTIRRLRELTGGTILNVYGLTEISPMGTATPEGGPDKPGTVGVADPYRGETAKAFVVAERGEALTAEEVMAWCRQSLAPYKAPTQVEFLQELPKSAVGKILRRELRARDEEPG